jgi:hypothetical protein
MSGGIFNTVVVEGYRFATASLGASDRSFVTVDPTVVDLRTKTRNMNATFVSQLSVNRATDTVDQPASRRHRYDLLVYESVVSRGGIWRKPPGPRGQLPEPLCSQRVLGKAIASSVIDTTNIKTWLDCLDFEDGAD